MMSSRIFSTTVTAMLGLLNLGFFIFGHHLLFSLLVAGLCAVVVFYCVLTYSRIGWYGGKRR